jgi:hypothetical protein
VDGTPLDGGSGAGRVAYYRLAPGFPEPLLQHRLMWLRELSMDGAARQD